MTPLGPAAGALPLPLSGLDRAFAAFLQAAQPSQDARHALLAALVSHQFGRGHACLDLQMLAQDGAAVLGWDALLNGLLPEDPLAVAASLPWTAGAASPMVRDGVRLYLRRSWQAEQAIRAAMAQRLQQHIPVPDALPELLERLFPRSAQADTPGAGPDWQKVACALAARKRFTLITGGPGTGKTTTVVRLLALLQAGARQGGRTLRVALAAPTGKAAARLTGSIASALEQLPAALRPGTMEAAQTLHALLQIRPDQPERPAPSLAVDLVIVDEASMIDLEMMARLLAAVPLSASLVLLGDKDQLASVEAGAVMAQLCEGAQEGRYAQETAAWLQAVAGADVGPWATGTGSALAQQTAMLRQSRRFQHDSAIGIWARSVNAGDGAAVQTLWRSTPLWAAHGAAEVDRLQPASPQDAQLASLVQAGWQDWLQQLHALGMQACGDESALQALRTFAQFQVLCAVREGPWGAGPLNQRIAQCLGLRDGGWYAGRPVMVTRNDYHLGLMNGDVGLCLPHAKGLRVAFEDTQGGVRWVNPARLDAVETVFAMTVHKSQGSEFAHVALVLPDQPVAVLTRELLYTGITRARRHLSLVVPHTEVLWRSVKARVLRSGGLADHAD